MAKRQKEPIQFKVIHIQVPISEEEREERIRILGRQLVAMDRDAKLAKAATYSQNSDS